MHSIKQEIRATEPVSPEIPTNVFVISLHHLMHVLYVRRFCSLVTCMACLPHVLSMCRTLFPARMYDRTKTRGHKVGRDSRAPRFCWCVKVSVTNIVRIIVQYVFQNERVRTLHHLCNIFKREIQEHDRSFSGQLHSSCLWCK